MKLVVSIVSMVLILTIVLSGFAYNGLIKYRNQTDQLIDQLQGEVGQLQDENQKTKAQLETTKEELSSLRKDAGDQLIQLRDQLQDQTKLAQQLQEKDDNFNTLIADLQSADEGLKSQIAKGLTSEREQRKYDISQLQAAFQTADEVIRQQITENIKAVKLALDSKATVDDLEKVSRGLESNAKDLRDLRAYLELIRNDFLIRLDESSRNISEELSTKLKELTEDSNKKIQLLSARISDVEKLRDTVELFIEEIRILEDKEVREALSTPRRALEVHPVLLLTSDDEEPSEETKQEMLRSLAVARAWYEDKVNETFRFNPLTTVRSSHPDKWFETCPITTTSDVRGEAMLTWNCMYYDLWEMTSQRGLPPLFSNSVYFVFMPSFDPDAVLGLGAFYNNAGLAVVGQKTLEWLKENNRNRLMGISVVAHELGHTFNLPHIENPNMVMNPYVTINFPKLSLTPGEVEVLIANPFFE